MRLSTLPFLLIVGACGSEVAGTGRSPISSEKVAGNPDDSSSESVESQPIADSSVPSQDSGVVDAAPDAPKAKTSCDPFSGDGEFKGSCRNMSSAVSPYRCIDYYANFPEYWCTEANGTYSPERCPTTLDASPASMKCYYPRNDQTTCNEAFFYGVYGPAMKSACEAGGGTATAL